MRDEDILWAERALIWERMDAALRDLKTCVGQQIALAYLKSSLRKEAEDIEKRSLK